MVNGLFVSAAVVMAHQNVIRDIGRIQLGLQLLCNNKMLWIEAMMS